MAPPSRRKADNSSNVSRAYKLFKEHVNLYFSKPFLHSLVFDPQKLPVVAVFLLILEAAVNVLVIHNVPYTEIDWIAYMQEVGGFLNGTMDYRELKGDTGPLVYPAGFVFIYSAFYYLTDEGKDIRFAQYIFAFIYVTFLALVFRIYCKAKKIPPYVLVLACCTSYRIHSIFILRLFNDTIAMWLLYASLNLFLDTRWNLASVIFSLAVSVKMNVLLYAPALLLTYLTSLGFWGTIKQLSICAAIQLFLGAPFLLTNPLTYLQGAFDLGRVFKHEWTVNYRFLPEDIFTNVYFHLGLLVVHLVLLAMFFAPSKLRLSSWSRLNAIGVDIAKQLRERKQSIDMGSKAQLFLLPLFTANLIGVACSRSLHYQFYVWYFHTLPYLAWCGPWSSVVKLVILGVVESSWNVFPSTFLSSALLHAAHIALLYGLWVSRDARGRAVEVKRNA